MRGAGYFIISVGFAYLIYAFNMDVSVSTSSTYVPGYGSIGGGEVANLDLMARRQNHLIVASLITLIGALMAIFGGDRSEPASASEQTKNVTPVADFAGERDLSSDPYRLWLASKHKIERNDVFDRFVMGERTYPNLDAALAEAHNIDSREAEALRIQKGERAAQKAADREAMRLAVEEDNARWREQQPKVFVGAALVILIFVGAIMLLKESPAQRIAREKKEVVAQAELFLATEKKFDLKLPADALNLKVWPLDKSTAFRCDGLDADGEIIAFSTRLKKEQVRDHFRKRLGKGAAEYEYLDDSFDWNWRKGRTKYLLRMLPDEVSNSISLCVVSDR